MKKVFILSTLFLVALFPLTLSFGQNDPLPTPPKKFFGCEFEYDDLPTCLRKIFENVLRYIAFFALIIGFILIGYGGFRYVASGSFDEAKNKIIAGVGGIIIAFLAYGLSLLIERWIEGGGEV